MARSKKFSELTASAYDIGDLVGIGRDMVLKHVRENDAPKVRNGVYPVRAWVKWYVERMTTRDAGIEEERRRLVRQQRIKHELENQRRRGELIDFDKYRADLVTVATAFSKVDTLAARIGGELELNAAGTRRLGELLREFRVGAARDILEAADALGHSGDRAPAAKAKRRTVGRSKPKTARRRT